MSKNHGSYPILNHRPRARFSRPIYAVVSMILSWALIIGLVWLLVGCGGGTSYAGAGSDSVPLKPNHSEAIARIEARGDGWLAGVISIKAADRDPPPGVNWATVQCPGNVVLYNTTFDRPVEHMERLLVHEAFEIQHGCKDNDGVADAMAGCYASGQSYETCLAETEKLL